jgi:Tfp pilus assembly protein PilW
MSRTMSRSVVPASAGIRRQRGIGLVEIMIAVTLGIIVTGAVVQIYLSTKRQNDMQGGLTGRQEVSRYATQLIQRDLQTAGFRGCLRDLGTVINTLNDPTDFPNNYARHVEGFEDVVSADLPAEITAGGNEVVADTDVLVIRTVDDPNLQLTANMVTSSSDPVTVPGLDAAAPDTPAAGDIMLVTDCGGSAIFEVTDFDEGTGTIVHDAGAGRRATTARTWSVVIPAGAQLFTLRTTTYFIRNNAPAFPGCGGALVTVHRRSWPRAWRTCSSCMAKTPWVATRCLTSTGPPMQLLTGTMWSASRWPCWFPVCGRTSPMPIRAPLSCSRKMLSVRLQTVGCGRS